MARTEILLLTAALMAAMSVVSVAQISSSCTNVLVSLAPCLSYITGNSSAPTLGCCSQLAGVVSSQPRCLCEAIGGGASASLGVSINRTNALELPTACNIETPPVSRCNDTGKKRNSNSKRVTFNSKIPIIRQLR